MILRIVLYTTSVTVVAGFTAIALAVATTPRTLPHAPSPIVQVDRGGGGHGSGVHVGNGYVITAAHVVDKETKFTAVYDNSARTEVEAIWSVPKYDVALMRLNPSKPYPKLARFDCQAAIIGEPVTAHGYPLDLGKVATNGFVAGKTQMYGEWAEVNMMDLTGAAGMSGGPIISQSTGKVRGIVVAGFGSVSPIMLIVPSSTICGLLANGGA